VGFGVGADLPSGFIFAIGRDAGVPHSSGNPADLMRLGQTIVFDIYPAEAGAVITMISPALGVSVTPTPKRRSMYDEVKDVYEKVIENIDLNVASRIIKN
jgi:Xaa-Pro aminopeptidase